MQYYNSLGWVSLHRELLAKPIWLNSTPEQKTILITILLLANHAPNKWEWKGRPYVVQPGQFITSLDSLARKAGKGISKQNVRTAIARFKKLEFLTCEVTNQNRLISICNYSQYQDSENGPNKQANSQLTSGQHSPNKRLTPNNNDNNVNKDNKRLGIAKQAIIYLNEKTNSKYDPEKTASTKYATARIRADKWTLDEFKAVIDLKVKDWANNDDMRQYLRPSTLFNSVKGPEYLQAAKAIKKSQQITTGPARTDESPDQVRQDLTGQLKTLKMLAGGKDSPELQKQITAVENKLQTLEGANQ